MPVMAVCPSCGKSYQAPDSMAGKSVRCKQCQTVFKIEQPQTFDDDIEGSQVDFDQLQRSFEGEDAEDTRVASAHGTRVGGPMIDKDGRVSIRRGGDVDSMGVRGDFTGSGKRTNLRFRYPFARQVDVGLPFLIVGLALVVPFWLSYTTGSKPGEFPTPGVGVSRYAVLLIAFLICVVPLVHIAATKASDAKHFNLPRNPFWRSFACASATLLLASTLFILAGGGIGGAILGILVGAGATVAAALLLYRAIPHEMGTLSAYVGGAAAVGAGVAALVIAGVNFAAASIARSQENPTLFQSPIAIGAPWVEPKSTIAVADRPRPKSPTPSPTGTQPTPVAPVVVAPTTTPPPLPIPLDQLIVDAESRKFVKSADQVPVAAGFRAVVTTLVPSPTIGVVRDVGGGLIELWDTSRWALPSGAIGRNFDFRQAPLFVNSTGDRVVRLVTSPVLRIESIALASGGAPMTPVKLEGDANRSIDGFIDASTLIVRARKSGGVALEQYDVSKPSAARESIAIENMIGREDDTTTVPYPLSIDEQAPSICHLPGRSVVVAGRDTRPGRGNQPCLVLYDLDNQKSPKFACDVPWSEPRGLFSPLAMAANPSGRVALVMDTGGEAWLTIWRMRDETVDGATLPAEPNYLVDHKLGGIASLRSNGRWRDAEHAIVWLDRDTLLLYGQHVIDARSGTLIGAVTIPNVTGVLPLADGEIAYLTESSGLQNMIRVKFDMAYVATLRK